MRSHFRDRNVSEERFNRFGTFNTKMRRFRRPRRIAISRMSLHTVRALLVRGLCCTFLVSSLSYCRASHSSTPAWRLSDFQSHKELRQYIENQITAKMMGGKKIVSLCA